MIPVQKINRAQSSSGASLSLLAIDLIHDSLVDLCSKKILSADATGIAERLVTLRMGFDVDEDFGILAVITEAPIETASGHRQSNQREQPYQRPSGSFGLR
jgi:hypothetical protein